MSAPIIVHPTAQVAPTVHLSPGCSIGPGCIITGNARFGPNVRLMANNVVQGPITIGEDTVVYPFACIGLEPQDYKFKSGSPTAGVVIGARTIIREHATIHQASKEEHPTRVGDQCMLMVASHVGHDAIVGNNVILVNEVMLAGHSTVGDNATISGCSAVHQFGRVGRFAFITAHCSFSTDLPPFCVGCARNTMAGINLVGLRRNGFARSDIDMVRKAYRRMFTANLSRIDMLANIQDLVPQSALVKEMHDFIAEAKRPVARGRLGMEEDASAN